MRYLTAGEILALHYYLMSQRWSEQLYGIRDAGLLESAVNRPISAAHYGASDLFDQAARLWEALSNNHPFVQGNKRTAYAATELFLRLNGWRISASDAEVIKIALELATGHVSADGLAQWLSRNTEAYEHRSPQ